MIESFNEMPLRVYEEILKLKDKELDAIDFEIELLALLTDMPVHDILDLPINEYRGYLNKAQFISNMPEVEGKCNMDNININGKNIPKTSVYPFLYGNKPFFMNANNIIGVNAIKRCRIIFFVELLSFINGPILTFLS